MFERALVVVVKVERQGQERLGLGGTFRCSRGEQRVPGLRQRLEPPIEVEARLRASEKELAPLGVVERPELERLLVELESCSICEERRGAIAGVAERSSRVLFEPACIVPRRPRKFERREVVVGNALRVVLGPSERFDPCGRARVFVGARSARNLAVRDVANEQMPKRILAIVCNRRSALTADELLALERVQ